MLEITKRISVAGRSDPDFGWEPDLDLTPYDENHYISRQHMRFFLVGNQCCVEDMGSRNGLFLNGRQRINPGMRTPLHNGDVLSVFNFQITYRMTGGQHFIVPGMGGKEMAPPEAQGRKNGFEGTFFLPSAEEEKEIKANRRLAWVLAAAALGVVCILALVLYFVFSGPGDLEMSEKIRSALDAGRFFEPPDNSVVALYRAFVERHPKSSSRAFIEQSIRDRFEAEGNAAFARYTRNPGELLDWVREERIYAFLVEVFPNDADLAARRAFCRGAIAMGRKEWAGALAAYQEALKLRPRWFLPQYAVGLAKKALGTPDALAAFEAATVQESGFLWSFKEMGDIHYGAQAWDRACDAYQNALPVGSLQPEMFFSYADAAVRAGRYSDAVQGFRKYILYGTDPEKKARAEAMIAQMDWAGK